MKRAYEVKAMMMVNCTIKNRPRLYTAQDTEKVRRVNETFYVGSCGFRFVSVI